MLGLMGWILYIHYISDVKNKSKLIEYEIDDYVVIENKDD